MTENQYSNDVTKGFNRISELLEIFDVTGEYDPLILSEIRERFMSLSYNLRYMDTRFDVHNLNYFHMCVDDVLKSDKIAQYSAAFFNLRSIASLNRRFGMSKGTEIMAKFFKGLEESLDEDEYMCSIGGNNGAVLFKTDNLERVENYLSGTRIIVDEFEDTEQEVLISASVGINKNLARCSSRYEIIESASHAMNIAKSSRSAVPVIYDEKIKAKMQTRSEIEMKFDKALSAGEFRVFYQPKVDLCNYKICGAEALCRWNSYGKITPPDLFIPILESNNRICELDFYVLERVCRDISEWTKNGKRVKPVSVNLSRCNFSNIGLLHDIEKTVDKYKVPHSLIQFEISEAISDVSFSELRPIVYGLRDMGFGTIIDNFGTGYSSLNLIRQLPWKVIKIDKSLLHGALAKTNGSQLMMKSLIALAHDIGMECIVLGVETPEDLKVLKNSGCLMGQGFYFDKPLPKDIFENRLPDID